MRRIERLEARACGESKPASSWRLARLDRRYDQTALKEAVARGRAGQGGPQAWTGSARPTLTSYHTEKPRSFAAGQGGQGGQGRSTAPSGETRRHTSALGGTPPT